MEEAKSINLAKKEEFEYIMEVFAKCTDDYLFFFDLDKDYYSISERVLEQFALPSARFFNAGDTLTKIVYPEDLPILLKDVAELKNGEKTEHNLEYRWVDKTGKIVWISCRGVVMHDNVQKQNKILFGRITEIGSKRKADNVTGLFAERQLQIDYEKKAIECPEGKGTIIRFGVDNFKEVNERYGMEIGDGVLKLIAECIEEVSGDDRCYKLYGDEFIILMTGDNTQTAKKWYHKVRVLIEEQRREQGYQNFYTISAGIVGFSYAELDFADAYNYSEFALSMAKKNGKNCSYIFNEADYQAYMRNIDIQEKLRYSVNHDFEGFEVFYQPIISVETEKVIGAEALLRYHCQEYGMLSPGIFIPILEESGLIIPVGEWVYKTAMKQSLEWQKMIPEFRININLSFIQICKSDVVSGIMATIKEIGISPTTVLFEFTESGMISYDDSVQRLLDVLNENRVKIALDDFGTGYSSLAYLQNLRVNMLKLDRGFTSKAVSNDFDFTLIGHIVDMAHSIGMRVCFEGIETEDELVKLKELEPDYIQGFYYGRPVDKQKFYDENLKKYESA